MLIHQTDSVLKTGHNLVQHYGLYGTISVIILCGLIGFIIVALRRYILLNNKNGNKYNGHLFERIKNLENSHKNVSCKIDNLYHRQEKIFITLTEIKVKLDVFIKK